MSSPTDIARTQVCIVGGGPTGIIYLKELIDAGVTNVRVFEAKQTSGGLFRGSYEDAMLTISNAVGTFSKMHNTESIHMYCEEYADYCDAFVQKFELDQYISFETVANKCTFDRANKIWTIHYQGIGADGIAGTVKADYLVVASGAHAPVIPSTDGLPSCSKLPGTNGLPSFDQFQGTVIHSSEYKSSKVFEGKQVLVVGSGESASDIVMAAAMSKSKSRSVALSIRGVSGHLTPRTVGKAYPWEARKIETGNGTWWQQNFPVGPGEGPLDNASNVGRICTPKTQWLPGTVAPRIAASLIPFLPKDITTVKHVRYLTAINLICGLNSSTQYGTKTTGIPQALEDGAMLVPGIKEVKPQSIVFADGTELEIDLVVLCTGFKTTFPFLEEESPKAIKDFNSRKLWKHMIDAEYRERLVFGGFVRPAFGSIPQMSEMQARVYAQLISGALSLPKEAELLNTIAEDGAREESFFHASKDIPSLTHFVHYSSDMASLMGANIDYRKLLVTEPKLFLRLATASYNVKRFYIHDDNEALQYDARNNFSMRNKDALTMTDIHIWFVCFAITTLVDIPMLSLHGVMPPTTEQRVWAWLTLPVWLILLAPSIYEHVLLWVFALMSPYTWFYFIRRFLHGGDNKPGDVCWAVSVVENWYINTLILDPFALLAFLVFSVASTPVAVVQELVTAWAFTGTC